MRGFGRRLTALLPLLFGATLGFALGVASASSHAPRCEPPPIAGRQDAPASEAPAALAQRLLAQGDTATAAALLGKRLEADPADAQARFALAAVQTLAAVERLAQDAHAFGLGGGTAAALAEVTLFGGEIPIADAPERVAHDDARAALQRFRDGLGRAIDTLAPLADPGAAEPRLPLDLGLIRLDFDGDGHPGEQLSAVLFELRGLAAGGPQGERCGAIPIHFDLGDAHWLRAYLHLLSAALDAWLAYDTQALWDATAHLFFARPETPLPYLAQPVEPAFDGIELAVLADLVAMIHLLDLPLREPARMADALEHLEAAVRWNRAAWEAILAETDDDREWLPSPRQSGVIPSRPGGPPLEVTEAMVASWLELLDESEALLQGRKLLPYWRVADGRGVNLRRVFEAPQRLDLLLWLQGAAAAPYLEEGELTRGDTWRRIVRAFDGRFAPFALWFN